MYSQTTTSHNRVSKYVNQKNYGKIRAELTDAGLSKAESMPVKDIILRGNSTDRMTGENGISTEKFIIRCCDIRRPQYFLIKECTKGTQIKETHESISYETALRIIERSTKWLSASSQPLVHEIGVKMVTDRLIPDTIIQYDRECFNLNPKTTITADSGIALSEYSFNDAFSSNVALDEPVDNDTCLLQINYERIIPENISYIIGLKNQG